jgi:hypothetical protein
MVKRWEFVGGDGPGAYPQEDLDGRMVAYADYAKLEARIRKLMIGSGTMAAEWDALLKEYHAGHDCNPGPCVCKCGCTQMMGCTAMGGLCSVCHQKYFRDYEEHGFKADRGAE